MSKQITDGDRYAWFRAAWLDNSDNPDALQAIMNVTTEAEMDAAIGAEIARQAGTPAETSPAIEDFASGFRDGWLDCRATMARFVEPDSPVIAMSIRGNWKPSLGPDPDFPGARYRWDSRNGDPETGDPGDLVPAEDGGQQ